jgi:CdiI N-terminal domain
LVTTVQSSITEPLVDWWVLYKENDIVFIQNELIVDETYKELINGKPFTLDTCYNYITPRITHTSEGDKISEWSINLTDI